MKRLLLVTACLLTVIGLRAQSLRTCRYWYDRDIGDAITTNFSGNIGQLQLDVEALVGGLHTLHLQVADSSLNWGPTKSFLFIKPENYSIENLSYRCWFDYDIESQQNGSFGNSLLLDVTNLDCGIHTLHLQLEGSTMTSTKSYLFLKPEDYGVGNLSYRCWFDYDIENQQTGSLGNGSLLLDVSDLSDGIHTLHLQLEGSTMISAKSYIFMKVPTFSGDYQYRCWFDEDDNTVLTGQVSNGVLLLDVTSLSIGQHNLNMQFFNGNLSSPRSFSFYRGPAIIVSANPVEGGTVSTQLVDSICTITATANEGYSFVNWTKDDEIVSTEAEYSFIVAENATYMANFVENYTQNIGLSEGWNWCSFNVEITLDDLKAALVEALPGTAISIKSQTQNTSYNPNNNRWVGSLAWDVSKMYMISVTAACEITLIGMPINPSEHSISIMNGANWIGFPFNASMSLSNAFAGFSVNGDRIKSQTNNALYNGIRWQGQLNALESGKGYIYISNSLEERTLTFPTSAK